jgi:hypothetical protein
MGIGSHTEGYGGAALRTLTGVNTPAPAPGASSGTWMVESVRDLVPFLGDLVFDVEGVCERDQQQQDSKAT